MEDFSHGSYVTIYFNDGTYLELKFITHNDFYFLGSNNVGKKVFVPFTNVKYIVS